MAFRKRPRWVSPSRPVRIVRPRYGGGTYGAGLTAGMVRRAALRRAALGASRVGLAYTAGSALYGLYKNRRKKVALRRRIGERIGSGAARRDATYTETSMATRTLYQSQLLNLTKGTAINHRGRDIVNFRGVKICFEAICTNGNILQEADMYLNVAVVSGKDLQGNQAVPLTDFFRGSNSTRGADFSTALSSLEFHCLPINADKYNVHKHIRMKLAEKADSTAVKASNRMREIYIPLKRQVRYDDTTVTPNGKNLYLLFWCSRQGYTTGTGAATASVQFNYHITQYWRDPKN